MLLFRQGLPPRLPLCGDFPNRIETRTKQNNCQDAYKRKKRGKCNLVKFVSINFFQSKKPSILCSSLRWIFDYTFFFDTWRTKNIWGCPKKNGGASSKVPFEPNLPRTSIKVSWLACRDCAFLWGFSQHYIAPTDNVGFLQKGFMKASGFILWWV